MSISGEQVQDSSSAREAHSLLPDAATLREHSDNSSNSALCPAETVQALSTIIDKAILRGVPAATVLRGFGASFRQHRAFRPQDYVKSEATEHIDDFISHDWASDWVGKALVLCLIYNSEAAAVVSLAVALALGTLQTGFVGLLPAFQPMGAGTDDRYGICCQVVCPLVFAAIFMFWQDIRVTLRLSSKLLFLDKYCIDQEDEVRKAAGIAGLGGFLRHTDRLVICWTPRYFTRLWCTYEVASWLYLQKPMSQVEFLPLSHAKCIIVCLSLSWVACSCDTVLTFCLRRFRIPVLVLAAALTLPVAVHWLRGQVLDICRLPGQLREFSVANSGCFCCANDHTMPGRPEVVLPCDRRVVLKTLRSWFEELIGQEMVPTCGTVEELFDMKIRDIFGPWVMQHAGPTQLSYKYIVLAGLPWLYRGFDMLACLGRGPSTQQLLQPILLQYPVIALAVVPSAYKATLQFAAWAGPANGTHESSCLHVLTTSAVVVVLFAIVAALWLPLAYTSATCLPCGVAFAGFDILVTAVLFRQGLARLSLRMRRRRRLSGAGGAVGNPRTSSRASMTSRASIEARLEPSRRSSLVMACDGDEEEDEEEEEANDKVEDEAEEGPEARGPVRLSRLVMDDYPVDFDDDEGEQEEDEEGYCEAEPDEWADLFFEPLPTVRGSNLGFAEGGDDDGPAERDVFHGGAEGEVI